MKQNTLQVDQMSPMERLSLMRRGEAILGSRQGDPQLHLQLGMLYKAEGQMDRALYHLGIAGKALKKSPDAAAQLADAYVKVRDFHSAKKYVRRMVDLQPRNETVLIYQAEFLQNAGLIKQSLAVWEKLTRLFPENPENWRDLASCLQVLGDWDRADTVFEKVLELSPLDPMALYRLANTRKHEKDDAKELLSKIRASIGQMKDASDSVIDERNDIEIANLYYAAGKLNTEIGHLDEAMSDYAAANSIRRDDHSEQAEKRAFANSHAVFTKETIAKKSRLGSESDAPIFILGMPRSGTTLVESLIAGHSKVTAGGEMSFIMPIFNRLGMRRSEKEALIPLVNNMKPEEISFYSQEYMEATRELREKTPHFTDKMPHNFLYMGLIGTLFPKAHIIHCRRHPVDNCLSIYTNSMNAFHNAYKNDLKTLGLYYRQYLGLMEHWRSSIPGGFHEVFYEDVVANTELNARAMIDYLDLEWEDDIMNREKSQSSVKTLSMWQVRQPIYTSSAGRWKKFEKHLGPLIEALGSEVGNYEDELAKLNEAGAQ